MKECFEMDNEFIPSKIASSEIQPINPHLKPWSTIFIALKSILNENKKHIQRNRSLESELPLKLISTFQPSHRVLITKNVLHHLQAFLKTSLSLSRSSPTLETQSKRTRVPRYMKDLRPIKLLTWSRCSA